MTKRPCPHCQATNPTENRFCGRCGRPLVYQTVVISPDENEPYRVETDAHATAPVHDVLIGRALAATTAALAAELVFVYAERRFLGGRRIGSEQMRQLRQGALTTLTGAALLFAEQRFAGRPGGRVP